MMTAANMTNAAAVNVVADLAQIPGLSPEEMTKAMELIINEERKRLMFNFMPIELRPSWVYKLIGKDLQFP